MLKLLATLVFYTQRISGAHFWIWKNDKYDLLLLSNTSNYVSKQSYMKMSIDLEHHNFCKENLIVGALTVNISNYLMFFSTYIHL